MIEKAVRILRKGGIVAFPTETVYGLGANVFDRGAVEKIFKAKGRPGDNPLIVHISDLSQLKRLAAQVPKDAESLMRRFWPGPLTFVFKKRPEVPSRVTAGLSTVAVRMPGHPLARRLIRAFGHPIAAPSANVSGRPSATNYQAARRELAGKADMILRGSASRIGIESTVLDCTRRPFRILRPGFVTLEDLRKYVPVRAFGTRSGFKGAAPSPGMKHRHYRPNCRVVPVSSGRWSGKLRELLKDNMKLGALSFRSKIPDHSRIIFSRNFRGNSGRMARELYPSFLTAEKRGVDVLVVEEPQKKGLGAAILDRLRRAARAE